MCASCAFIGPAENGANQVSPGAESAPKMSPPVQMPGQLGLGDCHPLACPVQTRT